MRKTIKQTKRWVIKVGSALLTDDGQGLNTELIKQLAGQINYLRENKVEVILVSSGSIVAGMSQLGMEVRPKRISELQAAAAVGQASLVRQYEEAFEPFSINIAQILLTHADISNRERYLNARSTLSTLLQLKVLPVINENDSVATDEICFGDNDNLASLVANLIDAETLILLTDQDGLFTADPRIDQTATLLSEVDVDDPELQTMAAGGSSLGRGGMLTKVAAAKSASRSGASTIIANGRVEDILIKVYQGNEIGTFLPAKQRISSKKQWIAGQMKAVGSVVIDQGAVDVLINKGKSLLAVGITEVLGEFTRGELITCVDEAGSEIARGLTNYSAIEVGLLKGQPSDKTSDILGYSGDDEIIHRDNLVLK